MAFRRGCLAERFNFKIRLAGEIGRQVAIGNALADRVAEVAAARDAYQLAVLQDRFEAKLVYGWKWAFCRP